MKLKKIIYLLIVGAGLASCAQDNNLAETSDAGKVQVHLNVTQLSGTVESRSTDPMNIDNENKIYSLAWAFYNDGGSLKQNGTIDVDAEGVLSVTDANKTNISLVDPTAVGHICVLANYYVDGQAAAITWPDKWSQMTSNNDNAAAFLKLPLTTVSTYSGEDAKSYSDVGNYNNKMLMFGYYYGNISSSQNVNIVMSRLATCAKIVLKVPDASTSECNITRVEIKNVPQYSHFLPSAFSAPDISYINTNLASKSYINYSESFADFTTLPKVKYGSPVTLYYYMGENMNPSSDSYTTAFITATTGGTPVYSYIYSDDDSADGYTLSDVTTNGSSSTLTADPYYSPKYLVNGNYYNYYYYRSYCYYNSFWGWIEVSHDYVPSNTALSYSYVENKYYNGDYRDFYYLYTLSANDDIYYPYYKDGKGYKHRLFTVSYVGGIEKTYKVVLGSDSPSTANRDYSLYRNNTYTFNINLK